MLADVSRRNEAAWRDNSLDIGRGLQQVIRDTPVGAVYRGLLVEQVDLIKSLPLRQAEHVHELVQKGLLASTRSTDIAKTIMESSAIPLWRAKLIARTEVSRAAVTLTQARAQAIGSPGYIWRTSEDGAVRPTHRLVANTYVPWDQPPKTDESLDPYHAGCGPNCFIGSTPLSLANGVHTLWRAAFDGEVVDLVVGDQVVTVTLNHPILTANGWVAAGLLQQGDQVVAVGKQAVDAVGNDEHEMVTFDDLHLSFRMDADRLAAGTVLDFHGDVVDQQVDQVRLTWVLSDNPAAGVREKLCEFLLTGPDAMRVKQTLQSGHADTARLRALLLSFYDGLARHCQSVRLAGGANDDPVATQKLVDGEWCGRVLASQCAGAEAAEIARRYLSLWKVAAVVSGPPRVAAWNDETAGAQQRAERVGSGGNSRRSLVEIAAGNDHCLRPVEHVIRKRFSGHVFTVEMGSGWFGVTVAEIVSKNCRCYPEPVLPKY